MAKTKATARGKGGAKNKAAAEGATGSTKIAAPKVEAPKKGHNGPDDAACVAFMESILSSQRAMDSAQQTFQSKQSDFRNAIKRASDGGMNRKAILKTLADLKVDTDELVLEERARARLHRLLGMPIGTQLGLLDEGAEAMPDAYSMAFARGFMMGRVGAPGTSIDSNPFNANSSKPEDRAHAEAWDKGWSAGQGELGKTALGNGAKALAPSESALPH